MRLVGSVCLAFLNEPPRFGRGILGWRLGVIADGENIRNSDPRYVEFGHISQNNILIMTEVYTKGTEHPDGRPEICR